MRVSDFNKLQYFEYSEQDYKGRLIWHDNDTLENTDFNSMKNLDVIRGYVGKPCVLHCAYDPAGHSPKSMHYKNLGTAIDFHFESDNYLSDIAHVCAILDEKGLSKICGFGIYPDWKNPGFHIDFRGNQARWGAMYKDGKQEYYNFEYVLSYALDKF